MVFAFEGRASVIRVLVQRVGVAFSLAAKVRAAIV
jgi:hypothetical protein